MIIIITIKQKYIHSSEVEIHRRGTGNCVRTFVVASFKPSFKSISVATA